MRLPWDGFSTYPQFLVYRYAVHPKDRSYRCAERHGTGPTRRDEPSIVEAKDYDGLGNGAGRAVGSQR